MGIAMQRLILPYTRRELPGWGRLLRRWGRVGYQHDDLWKDEGVRTIRGKEHGYLMELDMTNWSARTTFFLGRYYELHILRLLDRYLGEGDRFVDIGANVGMISLHASRLVGASGRVDAVEPNPRCVEQLRRTIEINEINNITIHAMGLADSEGVLELKQNHSHTGIGTFAQLDPGTVVVSTSVAVKRGDDVFGDDARVPKLVKMDVEGFELHAVRGMEHTLRRWGAPIIMEMNEHHLNRAGTGIGDLHAFLAGLGYSAMNIGMQRKRLGHRLKLTAVKNETELRACRDVLWVR